MKPFCTIGLFIISLFTLPVYAQDSADKVHKLSINGYVKSLQALTFNKDFSDFLSANLIHNRINLKWKPSVTVTAAAEFRNRLFWGEEVKNTPGFTAMLRNPNEVLDLSKVWIDNKGLVLHTSIERLWAEYRQQKWNVRIGRQRINWGIATNWNPNDIFNTYNFLDFDYEERAGSDAVKIQYSFTDFSHIELASNLSVEKNKRVVAAKYFLNRSGYDMQALAGLYHDKLTLGTGWAGSIGNAGFKGEAQLFFNGKDSGISFSGVMEADYVFEKGWYINGAVLYSSQGMTRPVSGWTKFEFSPSPEKLMPAMWNVGFTGAKEITPLFSARLSTVFSPKVNLLILLPSLSYSLTEDLGADLVWQSFFGEADTGFRGISHRAFLRMKWSF
ncbi:MAG: hypothetical protein JNK14_05535 [Chitinophagaceae bacterium]|nr:hypothetical protein [Chitinophagaceae bacterium]